MDETTAALREFAERSRSVARRPGVDAQAIRALEALGRAGVDTLLLKGAVLARTLYRAGEARGYYDVDLLISARDLPAAGRALAGLGYTNLNALRGVEDIAGSLHAEVWSALIDGVGNVLIDVHWRLEGCQAPAEEVWAVLWRRRASMDLAGRRVPTLDAPGLALHVALHAAQHGPDDLKAIGDLERGLERWPRDTWHQAAGLAHALRAAEAMAAGLMLVPAGAALAGELRLPPAEALRWAIAHRDTRPRGTFHLDAVARAAGIDERIGVLRRSLFPSRAWIAWEYRWTRRRPVRTMAAYLIHLGRSPVWAIRAWRFSRRARRAGS